jgi:hypothetical protein
MGKDMGDGGKTKEKKRKEKKRKDEKRKDEARHGLVLSAGITPRIPHTHPYEEEPGVAKEGPVEEVVNNVLVPRG